MAVSRSLRFQILRRDGHACRYCGATAPDAKLVIDHVVPQTLGGTDDPTNLITACDSCNGGKSATPPDAAHVAQVADDAVRWAEAMRHAADAALADRNARQANYRDFQEHWQQYGYGPDDNRRLVTLPADWQRTVDRLMAAGLPMGILLDCIRIAMGANKVALDMRFNYMCGVAWKKVTELQQAAHQHLQTDEAEDWTAEDEAEWNRAAVERLTAEREKLKTAITRFLAELPVHIDQEVHGVARRVVEADDDPWGPDPVDLLTAALAALPDVLYQWANVPTRDSEAGA